MKFVNLNHLPKLFWEPVTLLSERFQEGSLDTQSLLANQTMPIELCETLLAPPRKMRAFINYLQCAFVLG